VLVEGVEGPVASIARASYMRIGAEVGVCPTEREPGSQDGVHFVRTSLRTNIPAPNNDTVYYRGQKKKKKKPLNGLSSLLGRST
jgi:hypothetical protein